MKKQSTNLLSGHHKRQKQKNLWTKPLNLHNTFLVFAALVTTVGIINAIYNQPLPVGVKNVEVSINNGVQTSRAIQPRGPYVASANSTNLPHTQNSIAGNNNINPQVLGDSTSLQGGTTPDLTSQIQSVLSSYLAQGLFKGDKGDPGTPASAPGSVTGIVQNDNGKTTAVVGGAPIVTYIPSQPQNNYNGASLAGFTDLSAKGFVADTVTSNQTNTGSLNVRGGASLGTTSITSLTVNGVAITGSGGGGGGSGTSTSWNVSGNDIYNSNSGNVGIGSTTPSQKLVVQGNSQVTGQASFGSLAAPGGGSLAELNNPIVDIESGGNVTSSFGLTGIQNILGASVTDSGSSMLGYFSETGDLSGNTGDVSTINGQQIFSFHNGSGNVDTLQGSQLEVHDNSSGNVSNLIGQQIHLVGSNVNNAYALKIYSPQNNAVSWGNNYGIYIQDQSGVATGDDFNLYSAGAGLNYFGGNVGIGTSTPAQQLVVQGNSQVTGGLAVGGQAAIGGGTLTDFLNPILDVESSGDLTVSGGITGIQNNISPSVTANSFIVGYASEIDDAGSNTGSINIMEGQDIAVSHNGSGNVNAITGSSIFAGTQSVASNVNNLIGQALSAYIGPNNTVNNAYGLKINNTFNSGTLVNNYGLYIQNQSAANATGDNFNLYSQGPGLNYFGGGVEIGTSTPNPNDALTVVGTGAFSSAVIQTPVGGVGSLLNFNDSSGSLRFVISSPDNGFVFVGTETTTPLVLGTNDSSALTIDIANKVGIGTSSPASTLFVQGSGSTNPFIVASSSGTQLITVLQNGKVGIGTSSPQYLLQVGSSGVASGTVARFQNANGTCDINPTTNTLACSSDERLKKDIISLADGFDQIMALAPVYFNWNAEATGTPEHPGFVAQQVQKIMPSIVSTDPDSGLLSIGYSDIVPALVAAIQKIQSEVTTLQGGLNGNTSADRLSVISPGNFSGDSVGQAKILAGQQSVRVNFVQNYSYQPIVTITLAGQPAQVFSSVDNVDATGFTIEINQAQSVDVTFNWHSFASPQEQLTVSGNATQNIILVIPAPPAPAPLSLDSSTSTPPDSGSVLGSSTTTPDNSSSTPPTDTQAPVPTVVITPTPNQSSSTTP